MFRIRTNSAEETQRMGRELAALLRAGDVLGLIGSLGAGKTTLVQGIARGLSLPDGIYVNSPTFTIVNDYPTTPPLIHFDFYRISDPEELYEIGFDDASRSEAICVVEWLDSVPDAGLDTYLRIEIDGDDETREFRLIPIGEDWQGRLDGWSMAQREAS